MPKGFELRENTNNIRNCLSNHECVLHLETSTWKLTLDIYRQSDLNGSTYFI
jgi:hypothetical protein